MNNCPICVEVEGECFCVAEDRLRIDPGVLYRIMRCPDCGLGWTLPSLSEEELSRFYPPDYLGETSRLIETYQSSRWVGTASWRMEAEKVDLLERYCRKGRLLDVGCGEGKFLWALNPNCWIRMGLELNEATVSLVRQRIPEIEVRLGTIETARYSDQSLDVVTFWHVLEHLPDPAKALATVRRFLRPGGRVIVSLPNIASLQARWFRSDWYPFGDVPRHIFHFSPRSLETLLTRAGFEKPHFHFFSRKVNFHCWKHSTRSWCRTKFGNERLYPAIKPILHLLPLLERVRGQYAVMTAVARRPKGPGGRSEGSSCAAKTS